MCKISIVVPVYNVERYLTECVDSILNQTFRDFELVLVDDGSKDNSGKLCDEYAQKDSRIKVIHKENGGLSDARNAGIAVAKGEYIGFVDSDDCVNQDMFFKLYELVQEYRAEIAICSFSQIDQDGSLGESFIDLENEQVISKMLAQEKYFEGYSQAMIYTVAWNKLYKRSLFETMRYPKGKTHEDEFVTFRLLGAASVIAYTPYCGYLYRCRTESIMDQFNERRFHLFDAYISKMHYFEEIGNQDLWDKMLKKTIHMFEQYQCWQQKSQDKKLESLVGEYRRKIIKAYQDSNFVAVPRLRLEFFLFSRFPKWYYALWKTVVHKQ